MKGVTQESSSEYVDRNLVVVMRDREGCYFVDEHHTLIKPHVSIIRRHWDIVVESFFVYVKETGLVVKDRADISNINITHEQANKRIQCYLNRNSIGRTEEIDILKRMVKNARSSTSDLVKN